MPTKSELKYHLVWCTKYRRKVLTEEIQISLKTFIEEVCEKNGFEIEALETMEDHVHVFMKASGKDSVHRIISQIKGYTAFKLREKHVEEIYRLECIAIKLKRKCLYLALE